MTETGRTGNRILGTLGSAGGKGVVRMQDRHGSDARMAELFPAYEALVED